MSIFGGTTEIMEEIMPAALAGSVGLRISSYSRSGETGYWIGSGYEGQGLASKAVAAVLDQAFGPLGLDRVTLHTDVANERSRALARRLGFTEEGLLRQALAFPGERRGEAVCGLLADEWNKRSARAFSSPDTAAKTADDHASPMVET